MSLDKELHISRYLINKLQNRKNMYAMRLLRAICSETVLYDVCVLCLFELLWFVFTFRETYKLFVHLHAIRMILIPYLAEGYSPIYLYVVFSIRREKRSKTLRTCLIYVPFKTHSNAMSSEFSQALFLLWLPLASTCNFTVSMQFTVASVSLIMSYYSEFDSIRFQLTLSLISNKN